VRAPSPSFERLLGEAFLEIGRHGRDDPRVVCDVLESLERVGLVAAEAKAKARVSAVRDVAAEISGPAAERARTARERGEIAERAARIRVLAV
jgi:uncharacterized membrane protein